MSGWKQDKNNRLIRSHRKENLINPTTFVSPFTVEEFQNHTVFSKSSPSELSPVVRKQLHNNLESTMNLLLLQQEPPVSTPKVEAELSLSPRHHTNTGFNSTPI